MADEQEKILKILLQYVTDKAGVSQAKAALADIEKSIDGTQGRLKGLTKLLDDDLVKGTGNWAKKMNEVDLVGRKLEMLGRQIGGTWGEALATIGGGLGSVADAADLLQGVKGLGGLKGAGGIGGLGALGIGAAGLVGAGVGVAGYEGLRAAGLAQKGGASTGQFASVAAYGVGSLFGTDTAQKWFTSVATALDELPEPAKKATAAIKGMAQAAVAIPASAADVLGIATQRAAGQTGGVSLPTGGITLGGAGGQRAAILRNNAMKAEEEESQQLNNAQTRRNRIIRDARDEERRAEQDYQRQRSEGMRKFNLSQQEQLAQFNLQMSQRQEKHNQQMTGLAQSRDAVGYLQEYENFQLSKKQEQENFDLGDSQREMNYITQLRADDENFKIQMAQRKQAASRQLDDLKATLLQEAEIQKSGYDKSLGHAREFASQLEGIFSRMGGGRGGAGIDRAVDRRISQTIGRR